MFGEWRTFNDGHRSQHLGMDVLAEVHDADELDRAVALPGTLLGINNRNLKTLKVDLATFEHLASRVPRGRVTTWRWRTIE